MEFHSDHALFLAAFVTVFFPLIFFIVISSRVKGARCNHSLRELTFNHYMPKCFTIHYYIQVFSDPDLSNTDGSLS